MLRPKKNRTSLIRSNVRPTITIAQREALIEISRLIQRRNLARRVGTYDTLAPHFDSYVAAEFLGHLGNWAGAQLFYSLSKTNRRFRAPFIKQCNKLAIDAFKEFYLKKIDRRELLRRVIASFREYEKGASDSRFRIDSARDVAKNFVFLMSYAVKETDRLIKSN